MSFWYIGNIDMWLCAGVGFCIFWVIYKAIQYDYEDNYRKIRRLENNEQEVWREINKLKRGTQKRDLKKHEKN